MLARDELGTRRGDRRPGASAVSRARCTASGRARRGAGSRAVQQRQIAGAGTRDRRHQRPHVGDRHRERERTCRAADRRRPASSSASSTPRRAGSSWSRRPFPGGSRHCRSPSARRSRSAATVAVIIPEGAKLEAELLAPSRAVGFIRPGQEVRLMLQAFPHQRFGTVKGEIKAMSTTVLGPTEISQSRVSSIQEPVFRIRVAAGARGHPGLRRGHSAATRHAAVRRYRVRSALADPVAVRSPVRGGADDHEPAGPAQLLPPAAPAAGARERSRGMRACLHHHDRALSRSRRRPQRPAPALRPVAGRASRCAA